MNVKEVIKALELLPQEMNVYVPSYDGKVDIVKRVGELIHLNLPEGISIPNDAVLSPWNDEEFVERCGTKARAIRRRISPEMRHRCYEADGYQCVYCGVSLRDVPCKFRTLDHVQPVSRLIHQRNDNGVNVFHNLVTCCLMCNAGLGDRVAKVLKYGRYWRMPRYTND